MCELVQTLPGSYLCFFFALPIVSAESTEHRFSFWLRFMVWLYPTIVDVLTTLWIFSKWNTDLLLTNGPRINMYIFYSHRYSIHYLYIMILIGNKSIVRRYLLATSIMPVLLLQGLMVPKFKVSSKCSPRVFSAATGDYFFFFCCCCYFRDFNVHLKVLSHHDKNKNKNTNW